MKHAVKWIKEHARPLEKALYKYHFEKGSEHDVVHALEAYQNEDGGFGHGLEPDFINPNSNPIDCWVASKIIDEIGLSRDHEIVVKLISYLKTTPHKKDHLYFYTIETNNDYPHAPWWHYEKNKAIQGYNPTASLLGFLFNYLDLKDEFYPQVIHMIEQAINHFNEQEYIEMHELKCFNELYDYIYLDMNVKKFELKLKEINLKTIEKDQQKWLTTYCPKPLQVISSIHSPGYEDIKDLVKKELSISKQSMNEEGFVEVIWSWLDDMEDFLISKKAWQGILTLDILKHIKTYA